MTKTKWSLSIALVAVLISSSVYSIDTGSDGKHFVQPTPNPTLGIVLLEMIMEDVQPFKGCTIFNILGNEVAFISPELFMDMAQTKNENSYVFEYNFRDTNYNYHENPFGLYFAKCIYGNESSTHRIVYSDK